MGRAAHRSRVVVAAGLVLGSVALLGASSAAVRASAPSDLIDVVQLTGSGALTSAGTATSIVPVAWNGTNATVGAALASLPTSDSGGQHALVESGSASSDSELLLSTNGSYLTLSGYDATLGTTKVGSAAGVKRTIARIDGAGNVDTSTALTDAFAGNNFRAAATTDGSQYWGSGDGTAATGTAAGAGIVLAAPGASTSTGLETAAIQSRDVALAGGNVYFTQGAKTAGKGIWEISGGSASLIASEADPYGLVVLQTGSGGAPDTIYAADGTTGGIAKFSFNGTAWIASGSVAGPPLEGLAGRVENGSVQLYATTQDGGTGGNKLVTLTDSSGFGNTITGSFTTVATAPPNTAYHGVAFAPIGQQLSTAPPTVTLNQAAASRAIGETNTPDSFTVTVGDSVYLPDQLTVTATHAAHGSAADPVTGLTVSGSGATRPVTIASADTVGLADVTVTVTTPDGRHASTAVPFEYGVSAAARDATSSWLESFSNASTAQDAGDGYFIVGDDAFNQLALYQQGVSGPPVTTWNFDPQMGVADSSQIDIEASARLGDTIYWFGSEGNNSTGDVKANRAIVFATTISGSGASTQLTFAGFYTHLRDDLIAWDEANGNQFGFAAGAADGQIPKEVNGFNIEGAEFAAGGSSTLYLGFRAPIVPTSNRTRALVVPVTNLPALMSSGGSAGSATFGAPFAWSLTPPGYVNPNGNVSALGVREIRKNADDEYLIIAGSYEEVPPAPAGGAELLYTWDGNPADAPVLTNTVLPTPDAGSWESIVATPDPLADGDHLLMVQDDGDNDYYGDGSEAKDLDAGLQRDRADTITLALAPQAISFTSTPPSPAYAGTTYGVGATGGGSGNPVTFSIDAASDPGTCSLAGDVVTLAAAGSCIVDADQAGTFQYAAAPTAKQTIPVVLPPAPVVTPVVSGTLGNAGWYVSNVTVSWTISSPVPATGCAATTLTSDTAGTTVSCTSTSTGGSTTGSVTVEIDKTQPVVSFSGNAGSYDLLQTVAISCSASDPAPGSGIASSTCADVSAPAWTFGPGAHTLSAAATDVAGNTRTASTSFTVTVTPKSLCTLTTQLFDSSAKYRSLRPAQQKLADAIVGGACDVLTQLVPKVKAPAAAALRNTYKNAVAALVSAGWLTKDQAATLDAFVAAL